MKKRFGLLYALIIVAIAYLGLALQGCQDNEATITENTPNFIDSGLGTPDPRPEQGHNPPPTADSTAVEHPENGDSSFWEDFPPPSIDPATPIPPQADPLALEDNILVWVLLGSDTEPPFIGQTQAIHLLFINPRFSKASLISIPGDLYVYIPGYTMQRINTAYAIGGIETLRMTLAYNFGVVPSRFVLAHPGDFQWLVDDINGIEVTVFAPMPGVCGGIRAGLVQMDGPLALCYAAYRDGVDEIDRMFRQQQLLRNIFRKLTEDGNLIQLPVLFTSYEGWVKTDFALSELMGYIPLALRLADPDRVGYYMIGWDQITLWEVPGYSQARVFLPDQAAVREVLQAALESIMVPSPFTNQVLTLEAQLTAAHLATATFLGQFNPTPMLTPTPFGTVTPLGTEPILTPTITPPGYP